MINCNSTFVENVDEVDKENHFYRADKRFEKKTFLLTLIPALLKKIMEAYKEYKLADGEVDSFIPDCVRKDSEKYLLEKNELSALFEENCKKIDDGKYEIKDYIHIGTFFDENLELDYNLKKKGIGKNKFIDYFRNHPSYRKRFMKRYHPNNEIDVRNIMLGYRRRK